MTTGLRVACAGILILALAGATAAGAGGRVLTAMDIVAIRIVGHPELDWTTRVRPDGVVAFPYLGRIKAAGRTEDELARAVERGLIEQEDHRRALRSPLGASLEGDFTNSRSLEIRTRRLIWTSVRPPWPED